MIGEFIRQQRIKRDLTQEDLASKLRISRPTYRQIESGKRELTVTEAKKLASIFGITLAALLDGKETQLILEKEPAKQHGGIKICVTEKNLDKFKQVLLYVLYKIGAKPNVSKPA